MQKGRDYSKLSDEEKQTLLDLRDQVYEEQGCVKHSNRLLVNLCYHLMFEISLATDQTEGWEESGDFVYRHEEIMKLLDHKLVQHSVSDGDYYDS